MLVNVIPKNDLIEKMSITKNSFYKFIRNGSLNPAAGSLWAQIEKVIESDILQISHETVLKAIHSLEKTEDLVGFTFIAEYEGYKYNKKLFLICPFPIFNKTLKWVKLKMSKCIPPPEKGTYNDIITGCLTQTDIAGWVDPGNKIIIFTDEELYDAVGKLLGIYDTY